MNNILFSIFAIKKNILVMELHEKRWLQPDKFPDFILKSNNNTIVIKK